MENPQSGYLKQEPCVQGIPYKDVSYCKHRTPYRKLTRLWTDLGGHWDPKPTCLVEKCDHKAKYGYHAKSAQKRGSKIKGRYPEDDTFTREELYRIPAELCDEIANAATSKHVSQQASTQSNTP